MEDITKSQIDLYSKEAFYLCKNLDNLEQELTKFIASERMANVRG